MQNVEDSFDQVVPNAADKRDLFLSEILKRTNNAQLGLELGAIQPKKREERYVLRGSMKFGNAFRGKHPVGLEVYADPIGAMLQTGWQLSTQSLDGVWGMTGVGDQHRYNQARVFNDPNTQRQVSGILQAFQQGIFLPTLQLLIDAVERQQRPSQGFLGA